MLISVCKHAKINSRLIVRVNPIQRKEDIKFLFLKLSVRFFSFFVWIVFRSSSLFPISWSSERCWKCLNLRITVYLLTCTVRVWKCKMNIQWACGLWWRQIRQRTKMLVRDRTSRGCPGRSWRTGSCACRRRPCTSNGILTTRTTRSRSEKHTNAPGWVRLLLWILSL